MMGSNLKEALLPVPGISPPTSSSPSETVSDDLSKTDRSSPSDMAKNGPSSPYSPPPSSSNASIAKNPSPPSPPSLEDAPPPSSSNASIAKNPSPPSPPSLEDAPPPSLSNDSIVKIPSPPSPPSLENANVGKNPTPPSPPSLDKAKLAKNLPPSSPPAEESSSKSTKPPGGISPDRSTSPSGPSLGSNDPSTVFGRQEDLESPRTALITSPSSSSSSPPASRLARLVGFAAEATAPSALRSGSGSVAAPGPLVQLVPPVEGNVPAQGPADSVGVEKVIGVFGFSLFGSISLLPSTMEHAKSLPDPQKTAIMVGFGLIWVAASAGVLYGLHGKTEFEQAVCRHTGRLGMFGVALLVLLHVGWTLPAGTGSDIAFYSLLSVAFLLHLGSWIASCVVGEDRMEATAPAEAA